VDYCYGVPLCILAQSKKPAMDHTRYKATTTDWLYLLFWAILPLIYVKSIVDYSLLPRQLYASVFVLLIAVLSWKTLFKNGSLRAPLLWYSGFMVVMTISSFGAINPVESYATLSRFVMAFSYLLVTLGVIHSGTLHLKHMVKGIVLFATLAGVFTLVEIFRAIGSGDFFLNIYTVSATFSHKNLLSSVLLFSIPFVWMGNAVLSGMWKKGSLLLLFLLIAEIFVLRTRGVWVSFFLASVLTLGTYYTLSKEVRNTMKLPGRLIGLGLGIAVVLLVGFFMSPDAKTSLADTSNLDKRTVFWEHSLEMLKEKPLLGVGPGNWKIYFPKYGLKGTDISAKQGITHIQRPHNDYLWVLSEGGPLSLVFFLGVFVVTFVRLRKNLRIAASREDRLIDLALLFGLVAYMGFSFTDFPMERTSHTLLLFSLVALSYRHAAKKALLSGVAPRILVIAAAGVSLLISYYRIQGERHSLDVLQANGSRNATVMIQSTELAINSFFNMDNFANPLKYYSSIGYLVKEDLKSSWEDAQQAYQLHPYNIVVLNQLGNVKKAERKLDEALRYYDMVTDLSPRMQYARLSKAEILLNKNQYSDAMYELNWVNMDSQNARFLQLVAIVVPKFLEESAVNGRMAKLAQQIRLQQPANGPEYIQAYRTAKLNLRANP
tara:strand:+ start:21366 stop:23345 length:1980 start_codon:yes stop_codon:yes gene_type:complete